MNNWTERREQEIRERIQNASPLPWVQDDDPMLDILEDPTGEIVEYLDFSSEPDATLLANAPQDLADALNEIARLRALTMVDDDMVERALRSQSQDTTHSQGRVYSFDDTPTQSRATLQQAADTEDE